MRWSFLLPLFVCACGLTARGSGPPDGGLEEIEAGAGVDAGLDAAADAAVDADAGDSCLVSVEDQFTTVDIDPAKWNVTRNSENADYPKPYFNAGPLVAMLEPTKYNARGGLWYVATVPFTAIDVELDVHAVCAGGCGDGLTISFLDAATPAKLGDAVASLALGMPTMLNGAAVSLDLTENSQLGDGPAPNAAILEIDATKTPGQYDWTLAFSPQNQALKNARHRFALSVRSKQVTVRIDGAVVLQGAMPRLPLEGTFGITASSGGATSGIYVGDVRAKFYRCNAP